MALAVAGRTRGAHISGFEAIRLQAPADEFGASRVLLARRIDRREADQVARQSDEFPLASIDRLEQCLQISLVHGLP
jgi:hypothetical protein